MSHARKATELDARDVEIRFSPGVRRAFGDLAAAVHLSKHFDADILRIVESWAANDTQRLHDVLVAFPVIAEQLLLHVNAVRDDRAQNAWREICNQMPEKGFSVFGARRTGKGV